MSGDAWSKVGAGRWKWRRETSRGVVNYFAERVDGVWVLTANGQVVTHEKRLTDCKDAAAAHIARQACGHDESMSSKQREQIKQINEWMQSDPEAKLIVQGFLARRDTNLVDLAAQQPAALDELYEAIEDMIDQAPTEERAPWAG